MPKNTADPDGDDSLGMLDDAPSPDTTGLGLLGGTAQVSVSLPKDEDDELADDEVVDGEMVSDLIIDTSAVADEVTIARISRDTPDIVIELPAEELPAQPAAPEPEIEDDADGEEIVDAEIVLDAEPGDAPAPAGAPEDDEPDAIAPASDIAGEVPDSADVPDAVQDEDAAERAVTADSAEADSTEADTISAATVETDGVGTEEKTDRTQMDGAEDASAVSEASGDDARPLSHIESAVAAAKAELREAMTPAPKKRPSAVKRTAQTASKSSAPSKASAPAKTTAARSAAGESAPRAASAAPAPVETTNTASTVEENHPVNDPMLTSKRLDDLSDAARESADLLTPDRLLDPSRVARPEPEGTWSHLLYSLSGGRINIGDSRKARERKQLTARIAAPLAGTARFVPVLSRKGGVGKTTVTALLGMALADARDDRVIAVDANPDRGTLAERVVGSPAKSVRDLVRAQHSIRGFHDISALVARDETRLDVLASDSDPRVAEAFGDEGYRDVATVAAQYYSLVLTDSGTGIVHSVMSATLDLADQLVIVSGLSVDEARLASETITWLESNGHADLARNAIVVLNQSAPGAPMVRLSELESHFSTRARNVLRIPYDPQIAGGGAIDFASLQPETRRAARELAAALIEGLRVRAA